MQGIGQRVLNDQKPCPLPRSNKEPKTVEEKIRLVFYAEQSGRREREQFAQKTFGQVQYESEKALKAMEERKRQERLRQIQHAQTQRYDDKTDDPFDCAVQKSQTYHQVPEEFFAKRAARNLFGEIRRGMQAGFVAFLQNQEASAMLPAYQRPFLGDREQFTHEFPANADAPSWDEDEYVVMQPPPEEKKQKSKPKPRRSYRKKEVPLEKQRKALASAAAAESHVGKSLLVLQECNKARLANI